MKDSVTRSLNITLELTLCLAWWTKSLDLLEALCCSLSCSWTESSLTWWNIESPLVLSVLASLRLCFGSFETWICSVRISSLKSFCRGFHCCTDIFSFWNWRDRLLRSRSLVRVVWFHGTQFSHQPLGKSDNSHSCKCSELYIVDCRPLWSRFRRPSVVEWTDWSTSRPPFDPKCRPRCSFGFGTDNWARETLSWTSRWSLFAFRCSTVL